MKNTTAIWTAVAERSVDAAFDSHTRPRPHVTDHFLLMCQYLAEGARSLHNPLILNTRKNYLLIAPHSHACIFFDLSDFPAACCHCNTSLSKIIP